MAQLGLTFDATTVAPQEPFKVLPAGRYVAQIIASEMRPTAKGDGQYLWLEFEILDGEQKGRKTWDRLNIINSNPQAVDIAQRQLSAICHALGKTAVQDSEDLHFQPMMITVRVRPEVRDRDNPEIVKYSASNEIRGYEAVAGGGAVQRPSPMQPARPAAAAATPAWRKRA